MLKLLRALAHPRTPQKVSLTIVFLTLVLLIGAPSVVNGQTPPASPPPIRDVPKTNAIGDLFSSNPELGKVLYESCRKDGKETPNYLGLPCLLPSDGVITRCVVNNSPILYVGGLPATCTYTSTVDGSQYIGGPNAWGSGDDTNYYSDGTKVDRTSGGTEDPPRLTDAPNPPAQCSWDHMGQCFLNLPGLLFSALGFLLLMLSSMILGIAGVVFNWVVIRTVFQFALYFGTSEGMIVAWGVLRDIANIGLLFSFIFMGIATILNTQSVEGFTAKKALPSLIIFAVLLNFSLFATQGIIDVANGFSSVFASYAGNSCETTTSGSGVNGQSNADCANLGISSKILKAAGMHQIFPSGDQAMSAWSRTTDRPYTMAVMLIVLSIMVTITAMVLIAASIMLVIRVVVLSLLMVTSPIGFAGMAIPGLHKISSDWWHKLINQAFFAPVFLLMVFISLKLVDTLQDGQATIYDAMVGNSATGATTAGNMQVVVVFMIVIGFMIAALVVAQKMGAYGASFATKSAAGLTLGAHGFVARRTAGRLSGMAATAMRKRGMAETNMGRMAIGFADKGAKASYSSRNLVGGALGGATKLDFGKANKVASHGYHGIEEKAEKERLDYAKTLRSDRAENDKEYEERIDGLKKKHEKNAGDIRGGEEAIATAAETKRKAEDHLATRTVARDAQRSVLAANPTDARAAEALREEEANVARASAELANAEDGLTLATNKLSEAETERAALTKESERKTFTGAERQKMFATNIQHEGDFGIRGLNISAAGHGNHGAAAKILKDANKSDIEKALDTFKKKMEDNEKAESKPAENKPEKPASSGGASAPDPHH